MEISLNKESADALRELADALPVAISSISEETQKLYQFYSSLSDDLGVHYEAFGRFVSQIQQAQRDASDAVLAIPPMMRATATKIDAYIAQKP